MTTAIGIWSLELTPGKPEIVEPPVDIRITNVSFGETLKDASGRVVVKLSYTPVNADDEDDEDEDEPKEPASTATTVLAALKPGTFEQATLDVVLLSEGEYAFEVVGKNSVFLTGNYVDQGENMPPYGDDSELEDSDDEDGYDLRDVSSDVEVDVDEDMDDSGRFEEVEEEIQKSLKRAAEEEEAEKPEKKKKKGKDGKAEAAPEQKSEQKEKKEGKKEKAAEDKAKKQKAEKEIAGGIKILDAKVGTGPQAKKGSTVSMRYIGKLTNGKIFDQNTKGKPFTFHLGKGEVIKGWDEGIVGMQVGGERKLTIPAPMAYGKRGTDGIPANSTLVFDVKLLEIK